ncbi:metallophosphoesterase [Pseudorhodoferax sp. Leaf274]|uniref:metallophosphoesterase n=1 Tax=Pseudorhodoferax sp. Leaf274 TaxID=1736318 RepID=UPI00070252FA|nr:metallophosphoesterase [Pseudorhodoferax sp. Leaf274]KQP49583.1 metallophosphoesterase [Pseudorhodoferax sp. Leaf274]
MKFQLLSDLHLEVHTDFVPEPVPGADALILAGDVGSYQTGSRMADADFGLRLFADWPVPVYYVPGNHEYDMLDVDAAAVRLRETCERLGLRWLDRAIVELPGAAADGGALRLVGTTLWTDYDAIGPAARGGAFSLADQLKARHKAFRAADHYLRRTGTTRHGAPWLAAEMREEGLACQQWLRSALATPFDGTTVVVTHFAPSLHSADPRYGLTPGTAGFCNALDDLLACAKLWMHGHLHAPSDYVHRGCRVVANPLGYAKNGEQQGFRSRLLIEI